MFDELFRDFRDLGPTAAKRRFRQLAKEYHPDTAGGSGSAERFRALLAVRKRLRIEPVIGVGCSVKWRGSWRKVLRCCNGSVVIACHGKRLRVARTALEDVFERLNGDLKVVRIKYDAWQRLKKEL